MKKANRKGFTIAELLIVVAIIGVLTAIAIPIFRNRQEKAREAYDIYTMRQAASAAIELFYAGINKDNASDFNLSWSGKGGREANNIYGAYDPASGRFYKTREDLPNTTINTGYGKGTAINGGTTFVMGNDPGAYKADADYTGAVIMVSIYPNANPPYLVVYWKNNGKPNTNYIGDQLVTNIPKYCIKIPLG